ncbi:hypothetical protein F4805DRAFT_474072 [Annulohypoxylon moriforme]|nr:hypothetical protein F4805DRAFT_474072 [Annulohypoxylon moriforme]
MSSSPIHDGDPGRGPAIIGTTWTLTSLCIIAVGTRFYVRRKVTRRLYPDDWFMLAACVLQVAFQGNLTRSYLWGLGKHDRDLSTYQLTNTLKFVWINTPFGITASILSRISIALFLVRIFGTQLWLRWFFIVITVLQSLANVMQMIVILLQVHPVEALWDTSIPGQKLDPRIQMATGYLSSSLFAFGDLSYALLPVIVVWRLNMPLRRKIGLCILLVMSLITMTAGILRTVNIQGQPGKDDDAQYHACLGVLWTSMEQALGIIMGSVPPISGIKKLKQGPIHGITSSLKRIFSSKDKIRSAGATSELDSFGRATYYELATSNQGFSTRPSVPHIRENNIYAGSPATSIEQVDSYDAKLGKIRRTDQFAVTYTNENR